MIYYVSSGTLSLYTTTIRRKKCTVPDRQSKSMCLPTYGCLAGRVAMPYTPCTVEDILKVLKPDVKLLVFYATLLERLSPMDVSHCDVSAVLAEVQT